jgi:hypothetical protein
MTRMFSRHLRRPARPHRLGRLTTAALVATGLTTAGAVAIGAAPAYALGPGQVCMVNEPSGAPSSGGTFGHVGWMFMVGGSTTWVAGSTDGAVSSTNSKKLTWQRSGTKSALLNFFYDDGYAKFRCHSTNTSAVGGANAMIKTRDAQGFNTLTDNCLEDTVAIFNAYDSSMKLASGLGEGPNFYFDNLNSFGPVHILTANN